MTRHGGEARRWAIAVAISAALHALLAAALWRTGSPPRPGEAPIVVELVPGAAVPPARPVPDTAGARREPALPVPGTAGARREPPREPGTADGSTAGEPGAAPGDAPDAVRRWFSGHGLGPAPELHLPAGRGGAPAGPDEEPGEGGPGLAAFRARAAAAEARAAEISRYPDESWTAARDRLALGFSPGAAAFQGVRGRGAFPPEAGTWPESARSYARTGNPWAAAAGGREEDVSDRKSRVGQAASVMPDSTQSWFDVQGAMASRASEVPARRLATVVAVTHDAAGHVVAIRLVGPSGSAAHDAAALARANRLRGSEMGDRFRSTVAHWAYVTELFVSPAHPGAGLSFDANFGQVRPAHPVEKQVRSHVELVALHDAADPRFAPAAAPWLTRTHPLP